MLPRTCLALLMTALTVTGCGQSPEHQAQSDAGKRAPSPNEPQTPDNGAVADGPNRAPTEPILRDPDIARPPPMEPFLGATVGKSSRAQVEAQLANLGLECVDTSIRARMEAKRVAEQERLAQAKANGQDAVTAASWLDRKSSREQNPQIRLTCEGVRANQLPGRTRSASSGRVLFIFDGPDQPLRHASYQRRHRDQRAALDDLNETLTTLTSRYGQPSKTRGELPVAAADGTVTFAKLRPFEQVWSFSGLDIRVHALLYGPTVTVSTRVEVPHGVRPDAPVWVHLQVSPKGD